MSDATEVDLDLSDEELGDPEGDPVPDDGDVSFGVTAAAACRAALDQATSLFPGRVRASDGIMGDARHRARKSDHNDGNAFDLTHDPAHGCDAHALVEQLLARRDPRVKYVISNRRIASPAQGWRPYKGSNPHEKHAHVSIHATARDDTSPWWTGAPQPPQLQSEAQGADDWTTHPRLKLNDRGPMVTHLQELLIRATHALDSDGIFGASTDANLKDYQKARALDADGICGPKTWERLRGVVRRHALLLVDGELQREGSVVNLVAHEVQALTDVAATVGGPDGPGGVRQMGHAGMRRLG